MIKQVLLLALAALAGAGCTGFDIPDQYPSDVIAGTEYATEPFRLEPGTSIFQAGQARSFEIPTDLSALHNLEQCLPGSVVMEFMVAPDGQPVNVRIIDSQPPGAYDHVAFRALQSARFEPKIEDGVWQPALQRRPITFDVPHRCD